LLRIGQERKVPDTRNLRYVQATNVESDGLPLCGLPVETDCHQKLGRVDGVIVEPSTRRLHYLVVDGDDDVGRYLMPLDAICLDPSSHTLKVMDEPDPASWEAFDPDAYDDFGDDDLLAALFSRPAA
jgi:hypothetical protein